MAPARDWLMTAVGPPPWAIRILDRKASRSAQKRLLPFLGLRAPERRSGGGGGARRCRRGCPCLQTPEQPDFGLPSRLSVDFPGVQKLDAQGQSFLRRPVNLFAPFARAVSRLVLQRAFTNNFCFGMPAPAQSVVSGDAADAIGVGNHAGPGVPLTRERSCTDRVPGAAPDRKLKIPNLAEAGLAFVSGFTNDR